MGGLAVTKRIFSVATLIVAIIALNVDYVNAGFSGHNTKGDYGLQ